VHTDRDPAVRPRVDVEDVEVNGSPLNLERKYTCSVKHFLSKGGDSYHSLENKPTLIKRSAGLSCKSSIVNYFEEPIESAHRLECVVTAEFRNGIKHVLLKKDGRINLVS
jgi:hypothetical protein